jgi:hypothetical protein
MAGSKVSNFAIGDSNIQSVMLTLDKTFKGQHQVSLTNYDTTAESQVAAGSVIEIGGALYTFDSNESITGSPSDGTVYIMAVPAGDSVTCAYTNTAPTWSDSKQGWYGTGGTANNRYLEFFIIKSGSDWIKQSSKENYVKIFKSSFTGNPTSSLETFSWSVPWTKWYKIYITGKGGYGGNAAGVHSSGGGGSGATGFKMIRLNAGTVFTVTFPLLTASPATTPTFTELSSGAIILRAENGASSQNALSASRAKGINGTSAPGMDEMIFASQNKDTGNGSESLHCGYTKFVTLGDGVDALSFGGGGGGCSGGGATTYTGGLGGPGLVKIIG